ncbi:PaaI family thioesterase [Mycolicibacterium phlei]|jgi:acyl-coenzyme A thioesterase PaaI-like protein|uniref:PaaI family thioesterase n=1 Tax=Mycolicibacterium phlei TaxID=1771 RepID=UPI0009DA6401|nr:PaaI family thioesterase [Mycolicibacterium phlei]MBF4193882.1 aromatic compounds degradation protein paaI [Mycolicibacterium phlei]
MSAERDALDIRNWVGADFQSMPKTDGDVPLCGACLKTGQCRLGVCKERWADGRLTSDIVCPASQEGGPNVAHGGWTASVLDEILGHVPIHNNQMTVTGTLTVHFRKPVPIERPLRARAWIDRVDGKKWFISGELVLASTEAVLAEATGVWIARDPSHFVRHEAWLAEQDKAATAGDD